jgi:putative ABC transport system permease protein
MVRVSIDPEIIVEPADADRMELLPGTYLQGVGAPFLVAPETAKRLGVDHLLLFGEIAVTSSPLSIADQTKLWNDTQLTALVNLTFPDPAPYDFAGLLRGDFRGAQDLIELLVLGGIAVTATAVSVLLAATQSRRDNRTMFAIGAQRSFVVRTGMARAAIILGLGVPLGVVFGVSVGAFRVAWSRHLAVDSAWLNTVPDWGFQATVAVAVTVAGLGAALLFTRPPRTLLARRED